MSANGGRASWLAFAFDDQCKLSDRAMLFGTLPQCAETLFSASISPSRPINMAAAVFCLPSIGPPDLRHVMNDIVALRCPRSIYSLLTPVERSIWEGREYRPGECG